MPSSLTEDRPLSIQMLDVSDEEHFELEEVLQAIRTYEKVQLRRCKETGHVFLLNVEEEVTA